MSNWPSAKAKKVLAALQSIGWRVPELSWEAALVWLDDRADYSEVRMVALAPIGDILYFVAFVDRESTRRIISLHRANRREANHYVKANQRRSA